MISKQLQYELDLSREATQRIRRQIQQAKDKGYFSSTDFGRTFVRTQLEDFAKDLFDATEKPARGKATTTNIAICWQEVKQIFNYLEPDAVSAVCLKLILDSFGISKASTPTTQEAASFIGRGIEDEMRFIYYSRVAPEDVVAALRKELNTPGSNPHYRRYGAKYTTEKLLTERGWSRDQLFPNWSTGFRTQIGLFVLDVSNARGFTIRGVRKVARNKSQGFIDLSDSVKAHVLLFQDALECMSYKSYPLIERPREWEYIAGPSRFNHSGGYYLDWVRQQNPLCRKHYDSEFGSDAIQLLNTLHRTAWSIDSDIFQVQQKCLEFGNSIASLQAVIRDPRLDHDMPDEIKRLPKDDPKRIAWKKERSYLYVQHAESVKRNQRSRTTISLADRYLKYPRFYLSWSCDYRGRMYSQQSFLHQHSSDFERSLLTFSDGCKLDERGEYWAAQAIGSAVLGSRASFQDRNRWTYTNKELIKAIADNPIALAAHWEGADKPWQFLQLALEWNKVVLKKEKHLWDVPIGADSTSSGLQLLSAMRRDPKGMKYSNLYPPEYSYSPPLDAYQEVLRIARELANESEDTAYLSDYLTSRKLGKPVLMKLLYNASLRTNRNDVRDFFIEQRLYPDTIDNKEINRITDFLRIASRSVFPMAFEALEWIQKLFKEAKENGTQSFKWTTPTQDLIELIEFKWDTKTIRTSHHGEVRIGTDTPKEVDLKAIGKALAPSFVHSYDAAVLKSSFKDWNHPITLIHDQLKVLPNNMDRALERVRKGFVHVCSGDPLASLADDLGVSDKQLPRLKQGSGKLLAVLDSAYMFN